MNDIHNGLTSMISKFVDNMKIQLNPQQQMIRNNFKVILGVLLTEQINVILIPSQINVYHYAGDKNGVRFSMYDVQLSKI